MHTPSSSRSFYQKRWRSLLTGALLCGAVSVSLGQPASLPALAGVVRDSLDQQPVAGVSVFLPALGRSATTDANGAFRFSDVPSGPTVVYAKARGYANASETVSIEAGENRTELALSPDAMMLDTFVVPATAGGLEERTLTTSLAISSVYSDQLEKWSPRSYADAIKLTGGFQVEAQTGESSNTVLVRGLPNGSNPQTGGTYYLALLEDGLPIFNDYGDWPLRYSDTVNRIEAVRGGNSSIAQEQAVGGFINFINAEGGPFYSGRVKLEFGDFHHQRVDATFGGPLGKDTSFFLGGFFRTNDGIRDVGFTSNEGGQLLASLKHKFADGSGFVKATFKILDDQVILYGMMPMLNPGDPASLAALPLGTGTLLGPDTRSFGVPGFTGLAGDVRSVENRGQFSRINYIDLELDHGLGAGWKFNGRFRRAGGEMGYETFDPVGNINVMNADQMAGTIRSRIVALGGEFASRYSSANAPGWRLVQSGTLSSYAASTVASAQASTLNGNGLLAENQFVRVEQDDVSNTQFNFTLSKAFDTTTGNHSLQWGAYHSRHYQHEVYVPLLVLTDVKHHATRYDLQFLDAAGDPVGFGTLNGVSSLQSFVNAHEQVKKNSALWVLDNYTWANWTVNGGVRYHRAGGSFHNWGGWQVPAADLSGGVAGAWSLWDSAAQPNPVLARTPVLPQNPSAPNVMPAIDAFTWTLGASYLWRGHHSFWARYSDAAQLPNARGVVGDGFGNSGIQDVKSVEAGWKFSGKRTGIAVSAFYTALYDQKTTDIVLDPITGNLRYESSTRDTGTPGVEIEATWIPVRDLNLRWLATLQDPSFTSDNPFVFDGRQYSIKGNIPGRQSRFLSSLAADYTFRNLAGVDALTVFANTSYVGRRPSDDLNTFDLQPYLITSLGLSLSRGACVFEVQVANVFNSQGLAKVSPYGGTTTGSGAHVFLGQAELPRSVVAKLIYTF